MEAAKILKVLVVDDHDIVRKGLTTLISRQQDLSVAGEAGAAAEAVAKAGELAPDVVVLDIRLPDASGIEACRDIRSQNPDIKVLMLTSYSDEEAVMGSIMAGASGYLLKEIRSQEIVGNRRSHPASGRRPVFAGPGGYRRCAGTGPSGQRR